MRAPSTFVVVKSPFDQLRSYFTCKAVRWGAMQSGRMARGWFKEARSEWEMGMMQG